MNLSCGALRRHLCSFPQSGVATGAVHRGRRSYSRGQPFVARSPTMGSLRKSSFSIWSRSASRARSQLSTFREVEAFRKPSGPRNQCWPATSPFSASNGGHNDADEKEPPDDHPFERSVVTVRVEARERFDPVPPNQCENGEKPTRCSQSCLGPETYPKGRPHTAPPFTLKSAESLVWGLPMICQETEERRESARRAGSHSRSAADRRTISSLHVCSRPLGFSRWL